MITVEGVTRRYGAFTAVDDVSVTAHAAFEPMARLIADGDDDDVVAAFESMLSPEDLTLLADPRLRAEAVVNARESIRQGGCRGPGTRSAGLFPGSSLQRTSPVRCSFGTEVTTRPRWPMASGWSTTYLGRG
jgi:hypothetical protein